MKLFLFLTILLLPASAFAQEMRSTAPIYNQKVEFNIPKNWKPVSENVDGGHYIMELIPENESLENWTKMFTVQGFQGAASKISPKDFLLQLSAMYKGLCGDNAVFELAGNRTISEFESQQAIIGCANAPENNPVGLKKGMGEVAYFVAVKGTQDIYIFHKSIRSQGFAPQNSPITKENGWDFISDFMPIKLCNKKSAFNECLK
ncbi:MAG TPA: hypothetical protein PLF01_00005 [Alphaproteobacteria bacterium]|nr:hypothetical protein [Alphaproteobacteria bacterium]